MSRAAILGSRPLKLNVGQVNFQSPDYLKGIRAARQDVQSMQEKEIIDRERLEAWVQR
jgi:hypothetical protein